MMDMFELGWKVMLQIVFVYMTGEPAVYTQNNKTIVLSIFQACLYEGSNKIEYRFGPSEKHGSDSANRTATCGAKLDTRSTKMEELEISLGNMEHLWGLENLFEVI